MNRNDDKRSASGKRAWLQPLFRKLDLKETATHFPVAGGDALTYS